MSDSRSLQFIGRTGPKPYDASIEVSGGVSGMKFGNLLLSEPDLIALSKLCNHLVLVIRDKAQTSEVIS